MFEEVNWLRKDFVLAREFVWSKFHAKQPQRDVNMKTPVGPNTPLSIMKLKVEVRGAYIMLFSRLSHQSTGTWGLKRHGGFRLHPKSI